MTEPQRYTLEEAAQILRQNECGLHGHDFGVVLTVEGAPCGVRCDCCGETWRIEDGQ